MSITQKAMVLNLCIGLWTGQRLDRDASRKVTEDAHADGDAARVNKHLVPKAALQPIVSVANAIRGHFYEKTLPWKDNGDRLLTRVLYTAFVEEHERLVGEFNRAVDNFLANDYPAAIDQASFRMGELFKREDYPSPAMLRHKFYVGLDIDAVCEAGDFRVQMDDAHVASIRATMEQAMEQRMAGAMKDVWERLARVVGHFAAKMKDTDAVFRNTTVTNLEELVDLLPGLNILDNADLKAIHRDLKKTLYGVDPQELRAQPEARSEAAKEADRIMDRMKGFMNAFNAMDEAA